MGRQCDTCPISSCKEIRGRDGAALPEDNLTIYAFGSAGMKIHEAENGKTRSLDHKL